MRRRQSGGVSDLSVPPLVRVHSVRAEITHAIAQACAAWGWSCEPSAHTWSPRETNRAVGVVDGVERMAPEAPGAGLSCLLICTPCELAPFAGRDHPVGEYQFLPINVPRLREQIHRLHHGSALTLPQCRRFGDLVVDPVDQRVIWRGVTAKLSWREYEFVRLLVFSAERRVTREQVETSLYRWGQEIESNSIDVLIHHLRRKLGADLILTVRGWGFQLNPALNHRDE